MQKLSLKKRIAKFLRLHPDAWYNGGEFERMALEVGYKSSNASRRCRELVHEGSYIQRKEENGSVWYRYHKPEVIIDDETRTVQIIQQPTLL